MIKELFGSLFWYRHVRGIQQRSITTTKKIRCPHLNRFWVVLYIQYIYTWTHSSHTSQVFAVLEIAAIHMAVGPFGKSSLWIMGTHHGKMWRFPKMGGTSNFLSSMIGISMKNLPAIGVPQWLRKPPVMFPMIFPSKSLSEWIQPDGSMTISSSSGAGDLSQADLPGHQTWQWKNPPKKGGFCGKIDENRLYRDDFPLPCLITRG